MAKAISTCFVDETIGRLPVPEDPWPISRERFARLAEHWRRCGLWLSLWGPGGQSLAFDMQVSPLWNTLGRGSQRFQSELSKLVLGALQKADGNDESFSAQEMNWGPWSPDLGVAILPITLNMRVRGALVAAFVMTSTPGESLARLCGQCELDFNLIRTMASKSRPLEQDNAAGLIGVLNLTIEQSRECEMRQKDIASLADNLEDTYEELHLVYDVSHHLGISQKPVLMLEKISPGVLANSRAAGLALVLNPSNFPEVFRTSPELNPVVSIADRVMYVGQGNFSMEDIDRLTDTLQDELNLTESHVLLNDVTRQRPGLAWTRSWLKHLIALPLRQDNRLLGVLYGINCIDHGDFTSVDVQLLRAVADRLSSALENQRLYDDLAALLIGLIHAVVNSIDAKDPYTFGHSERVAYLSRAIAQTIGLPEIECERVYLSGLLHDVGKIGVPDAILTKPGKLTAEEFDVLKKHPEIGERILLPIAQIRDLLPGVLYHHERMDGNGYPHRLAGRDIPRLGRIICLADSFDAMTTNRTYRTAIPVASAAAEIRRCSGNQFDPVLAEAFLNLDVQRLYEEAHTLAHVDPVITQIGGLCCALSGDKLGREMWKSKVDMKHKK